MFYKLNLFWTIIKWFTLWGMNFSFKKKYTCKYFCNIFWWPLTIFYDQKSNLHTKKNELWCIFMKSLFLLIVYTWWPLTVTFTFSVVAALNYIDLNGRSTIFIWRSQSDEHDPIYKLQIAMLFMMRFLKTDSATACQTFF
jgi:hypothetical protein